MSDFFDPSSFSGQPARRRPPSVPRDLIPGFVPLNLLVRTEDVAVSIQGLHVYPSIMEFSLQVKIRPGTPLSERYAARGRALAGHPFHYLWQLGEAISPDRFRLGVEYPGGAKASNLMPSSPTGPTLRPSGGRGVNAG